MQRLTDPARAPRPQQLGDAAGGATPPSRLAPRVAAARRLPRRRRGVIPFAAVSSRPRPAATTVRASASAAASSGAFDDTAAAASNNNTRSISSPSSSVAPTVAAVLAAGVLNRVLYRMALVPMAGHTFALAQFQNAAYVCIYGSLCCLRGARGRITRAQLKAVPLRRFAVPGACEAAAQLLLMRSAAHLPGAMLPLLAQTTLAWSLFWRAAVLGVAPTRPQAGGVALVAAGVALASVPASAAAAASLSSAAVLTASPANVALCVLSFAFPALATILKEAIFRDAAAALNSSNNGKTATATTTPGRRRKQEQKQQQQKPQQLDVLVVNLATSAFQAVFVLALLPLAAALRGVALSDVPALLAAGGRQLWGGSGGGLLALVPAAYVAVNIAFNVLSLGLVRAVGAVPTALTASAMVPLTVAAFALPLPLLQPSSLGPGFWPGAALAIAGLAVYNGAAEPGGAAALRSWLLAASGGAAGAREASPTGVRSNNKDDNGDGEAAMAMTPGANVPESDCAERRSWQRAADLAGAEADGGATAAAAVAAARLAELQCHEDDEQGPSSSSSSSSSPARVVVLPAAPLPPSQRLGVLPPPSPLPSSSSSEVEERGGDEQQLQQQQRAQRPAVPSP